MNRHLLRVARSMRLRLLLAGIVLPILLWSVMPVISTGATADVSSKLATAQNKLSKKKAREDSIQEDVQSYSRKISGMQGEVNRLTDKQDSAQGDLDAKRSELRRIQANLRKERARLARLRARLVVARRILSERLVELYKTGEPDVLGVVLQSDGFADLIDRGEFISRINSQDKRIVNAVRDARTEAKTTAAKLDRLERRANKIAGILEQRRDEIAAVRGKVLDRRGALENARESRENVLDKVSSQRSKLQEDVDALQKEQAAVSGQLGGGGGDIGPIKKGSGEMVWPVNGPITAPYCEARSWESCHPGIDIGVPAGTPIHAADDGTVAIAGMQGGYGNLTCIEHGSSISTCYGHQSSIGVSVGQSVSKGEVIGAIGCTGLCFGDHLHFEVRVNGQHTNPMNYL